MRAALCKAFTSMDRLDAGLTVEDVPVPEPGPGQVRVRVRAAGVNFPDVLMVQGLYQFKPPFPFSPGGEVAGVISAVGPGATALTGQEVIAFCGHGGFAEEVVVDEAKLLPVPPGMDLETAASFTMTYATSHYALRDRAGLRPGETLLVLGAGGGVGLAAVEIGKALGARVIAAASSAEKLAACRDRGADELINYAETDLREALKGLVGSRGVDVVYDPVGGPYSEAALRSLAWEGRLLVIGFAAGEIPKIPLNLVLLKGCQIVGVFWGAFVTRDPGRHAAHFAELSRWFARGLLRPLISRRYTLDETAQALRDLAARRVAGKACVLP